MLQSVLHRIAISHVPRWSGRPAVGAAALKANRVSHIRVVCTPQISPFKADSTTTMISFDSFERIVPPLSYLARHVCRGGACRGVRDRRALGRSRILMPHARGRIVDERGIALIGQPRTCAADHSALGFVVVEAPIPLPFAATARLAHRVPDRRADWLAFVRWDAVARRWFKPCRSIARTICSAPDSHAGTRDGAFR